MAVDAAPWPEAVDIATFPEDSAPVGAALAALEVNRSSPPG